MSRIPDPRTAQFVEAMVLCGLIVAIHLAAFVIASSWRNLVSPGYLLLTCLLIPLTASAFAIILVRLRAWHWGQVGLVMLLTWLMSFLQFLIVGTASASV